MRVGITTIDGKLKFYDADRISYTDAPGFVMLIVGDESVITFNADRIESVEVIKSPEVTA